MRKDLPLINAGHFADAFEKIGFNSSPCIVHASLSAFGWIEGGATTLLQTIRQFSPRVMAPAFTYKTMLVPETGPAGNALTYGSAAALNRMAQPFHTSMPVDRMIGSFAETLRTTPGAVRSNHPILSFTGIGIQNDLDAQTIFDPFAPIRCLAENNAVVLLIGVDHSVNTSIHLAEKMAGRRQFTRWALTDQGVIACPGFPGCSNGFEKANVELKPITRSVHIGNAEIRLLPLPEMLDRLTHIFREHPLAYLCDSSGCERCTCIKDLPGNDTKY